jgi:enoyl-[acyl-carrier protein] reductase II
MHEGNLEEGELEIGQVSALLNEILPAGKIVENVWQEFLEGLRHPLKNANFNGE